MRAPTLPIPSLKRKLPKPIVAVLGRLDRRVRVTSLVRGLGTTALVVSIVVALGMAADFVWEMPTAIRWGAWGAAVAAAVNAFGLTVIWATIRRPSAFDLAAVAERAHSGMGEELTGAVGLLGGGSPMHGSATLIAAVAERAAARVDLVEPARVIKGRGAYLRLALGVIGLVVLAAPLLFWAEAYTRLARHFLMPWADVERPGRHVLAVSPGDRVVPVGADLAVSASVRARLPIDSVPDETWLNWSAEGEQASHRVAMPVAPAKDAHAASITTKSARDFGITLPRLARSISYRVESGSVKSPVYHIRVVEPPAVAAIVARIEPPAYTKLPATVAADASRIDAFEGSKVTLEIKASRAVRSIEVEWPIAMNEAESSQAARAAASLESGGGGGSVAVDAKRSGPYSVWLRDEHGVTSRPEQPRRVIVRADAVPVVVVRGPEDGIGVSPNDTLGLAIAARDDVAVASVELHFAVERKDSSAGDAESGHVDVAFGGLGSRSARGGASLALGRLALSAGDSLTYRVRVADNRPAPRGPNVVWSPPQTLTIVAAAEPLRVRASRARTSGLRSKLESLKHEVTADREKTEKLRQEADAVRRGDGEWDETHREAMAEREAATRTIEEQIKLLGRELDADPGMRALSRAAQQVAQVEAEAARAGLDQARRESDPAARHMGLARAVGRLAAVSERLDDLTQKLDAAAREQAEMNRLSELAKRQEALAAAAQGTTGDRAARDNVEAEQLAVRRELDALLKKTPALRSVVFEEEMRAAEQLAVRGRGLAAREREEARRIGDPPKNAALLKELSEMQRDLEDDARKLGVSVDQALGENGRHRVNTEAIRQAVEPIERGDVEAGRERLEEAENDLRRLARDITDVQDDPKALAGRLFRRQDALNRDIDMALQSVAGKELTAEEKTAFAARLKPLERRQRVIADLARTIKPPAGKEGRSRFPHDAAREASEKTGRAAETLMSQKTQEITDRKNEAREALERLANDLHDPWRRQEPTRQRFDEARKQSNEVVEEILRNLRETDPRPDRPATTAGAAAELAERLNGTADKQSRVVTALEAMEPEAFGEPQRQRALSRAKTLEANLRAMREPGKREHAREALRASETSAHAAMVRLEQKLGGRIPADDVAQELADEAAAIEKGVSAKQPAHDAAARGDAAADLRVLAGAIRSLVVPDASKVQEEAVRSADLAAEALARADGKADAAAAAVHKSAQAARALADRLTDGQKAVAPALPAAAEPELTLKPEDAARAGELARRERRIKERLQALMGGLVGPQEQIRKDAVSLGQELTELRDRLRNVSDRAQYPAHEAANHVANYAPQSIDQGINQLAGGRGRAAREDERRAAVLLERGAELAEDVVAALRSEMPDGQAVAKPQDRAGGQARAGEALGDARNQMRMASQELDAAREPALADKAGAEARQAMLRAARALQAAAELANTALGPNVAGFEVGSDSGHPAGGDAPAGDQEMQSAGSTRDPESAPGGKADADLSELKATVREKTGRAWGELPAHLRNEILQMQAARYRDDYARIIQLYFKEIAAEGGTRDAKP